MRKDTTSFGTPCLIGDEKEMIDYIKLTSAQRDELQNAMKKVMKCRSNDRPDLDTVEIRVAHFGEQKREVSVRDRYGWASAWDH
jgi:hypothetical protein